MPSLTVPERCLGSNSVPRRRAFPYIHGAPTRYGGPKPPIPMPGKASRRADWPDGMYQPYAVIRRTNKLQTPKDPPPEISCASSELFAGNLFRPPLSYTHRARLYMHIAYKCSEVTFCFLKNPLCMRVAKTGSARIQNTQTVWKQTECLGPGFSRPGGLLRGTVQGKGQTAAGPPDRRTVKGIAQGNPTTSQVTTVRRGARRRVRGKSRPDRRTVKGIAQGNPTTSQVTTVRRGARRRVTRQYRYEF
jgi:hypothetical protein